MCQAFCMCAGCHKSWPTTSKYKRFVFFCAHSEGAIFHQKNDIQRQGCVPFGNLCVSGAIPQGKEKRIVLQALLCEAPR